MRPEATFKEVIARREKQEQSMRGGKLGTGDKDAKAYDTLSYEKALDTDATKKEFRGVA